MSSKHQHRNLSINLDNYEEYFLLYIDQELSEMERKAVEIFLEQHPELQDEWDQLQLTKCSPDDLPVFNKTTLLKNYVDSTNIESLQLLLIDDELQAGDAVAVEEYMNEHQDALDNLQLLRQAKLPNEQIVFPYKKELLKNEPGRIVVWSRRTISIAASLIIFLMISFLITQKDQNDQAAETIASYNSMQKQSSDSDIPNTFSGSKAEDPVTSSTAADLNENKNLQYSKYTPYEIQKTKSSKKYIAVSERHTERVLAESNTSNTQTQTQEVITSSSQSNNLPVRESNFNSLADAVTKEPSEKAIIFDEHIKDDYATEALNNIHYASYSDEEENEQERKGLKNIIRKANRIYNKVTHPEPDKTIFRFAKTELGIPR